MSVTFRPAVAEDWPAAWAIQREAFNDLVTRAWGGWSAEREAQCADAWDPPTTRMVLREGAVVGWVRVDRHPDHDWLDLVAFDAATRGHGVGTHVMRVLMREAAARGVPLWLSAYRVNPACHLYRRLGFVERPRDDLRVFMAWPHDDGIEPGPRR